MTAAAVSTVFARAASHPLLAARDLAAPLAWCRGQPVSAARFIGEAQLLAERLPARGRPINLCQDRYHFALGLAAALLRGQTSLLPPNALPDTLRQVPPGDAPYVLFDDSHFDAGGLPLLAVARPAQAAAALQVPLIAADVDAACLLTSGSTGAPQPHAKRWGTLVLNIAAQAERLAQMIDKPTLAGLTLVATVPAQHSYGLESSVLLALLGGAAFDSGRPFYPADIADALARVPRPRALVTTPFHLKTLLLAGVALPPTDLVLCATAPLSPQLAAQAESRLCGPLVEIYGCTEAGQVASRRTTQGDTWRTLGALRIAREPDATADGGERFIVSGGHVLEPTPLADVLELQDDELQGAAAPGTAPPGATRFRLLGRANDLVHVAGKRSSLAHLNFHLNRIDGVDDGAFWLPDDMRDGMRDGMQDGVRPGVAHEAVVRPVAFVVAPTLSAQQVIAALRKQLEAAFVPRRVLHVPALPREATGKLTAAALRRFALQTLQAPAGHQPPPAAAAAAASAADDTAIPLHIHADHPSFAGHFPGHPVLPGVVLLSLVLDALARQRPALHQRLGATPRIASAKFLAPVLPGAQLQLMLRDERSGVAFELRNGSVTCARGQLAPGDAAAHEGPV